VTARVYVPTTPARLAAYVEAGRVPAADLRLVAPDEDEESEYAALMAAADEAAELLDGPGRRVVLVAEVADPDSDLPRKRWVAVHADTDDFVPGSTDPDTDLGWFGTQEIPDLL
jgi:hypothetical protein